MAEVKWVKITTDMFDNRKIRHLRRLPEGNNIVLIWVMLLTMAGRCNAGGMIFLTENIPYTAEMLADELGFGENTVKLALQALERLNMIIMEGDSFAIAGWEEYQNIEGMDKIREQNRLRKQRQREREKLRLGDGNVMSRDSHATDIDKEIEKEIDKDIEKEKENKKKKKKEEGAFEHFWEAYPKKVGKEAARKAFEKVEEPVDKLIAAVDRHKKSKQWNKEDGQYIPNPATWLNQGRWEDEMSISAEATAIARMDDNAKMAKLMENLKTAGNDPNVRERAAALKERLSV